MFIYVLAGLAVKIIFNVPLMYSFERLGLHAGYGVVTATILGFSTSIILILRRLHKKVGVNYEQTVRCLINIIYACLIMAAFVLMFQLVIPITTHDRLTALLLTALYSVIGAFIYIVVTAKDRLLQFIFGESFIKRIFKKISKR